MSDTRESKFYPIVARWLKKHHHCFKTDINKGLRYSRIDVIGVRDIGGDLSGEVETISVEVKKGGQPFATASGQALGYNVYANLVYLADVRDTPFTPDEIDIASHLGIGLIQITRQVCKEVLSSPYYKPVTRLNLLLLEKLCLGRCRLCDCFFDAGNERNPFSSLARENMKKAIAEGKGLMFWNYAVGKRKCKTDATYETYERRLICPDCVENIATWLEQVKGT